MVHEIILSIDPTLKRIEEILLWKNKVLTSIIFTACNISLWLLKSFHIRTYCTISFILLIAHLLDTYRTKMKRKIKSQTKPHSIIGKYVLNAYEHGTLVYQQCLRLKKQNRRKYFIMMIAFWLALAVFGVKVKGFYIAYCAFWIVFFIPAIIHYNVPNLILVKALPFLEQLDRSMEYERRSVIDKAELLVDVKVPQSEIDDDEMEDEYLSSFKLEGRRAEELKKRSSNLDRNDEDLVSSTTGTGTTSATEDSTSEDEDDYSSSDVEADEERQRRSREDDDEDDEEVVESIEEVYYYKQDPRFTPSSPPSMNTSLDSTLNSFLPNETLMPSLNESDFYNNQNDNSNEPQEYEKNKKVLNDLSGNSNLINVVRIKKVKNRPSLFDYYVNPASDTHVQQRTSTATGSTNDKDIDDSFDFLDDELNKF